MSEANTIFAGFLVCLSNVIAPTALNLRATFFQRSMSLPFAWVCWHPSDFAGIKYTL